MGDGVGFLCRKTFSLSIVSSPVFRLFEIIIISFKSDYNSFVAACVYRPPGSCTTQFLEDFLALSGFLSSTGCQAIEIGPGLMTSFSVAVWFKESAVQLILGHTLDILISPSDSYFVHNVSGPTHTGSHSGHFDISF